jgi:Carboxypeptidase regulatory-like domain
MCWRNLVASFVFAGSLVLAATLPAQTSSVEGNVTSADGRALQNAEVHFDQKGGGVSPIISRTDVNGHYMAALQRGMYKMTLLAGGKVQASITVKATGANSRIDFDLRPSAERKIKHYVWAGGRTGSNLPGRWLEAGIRGPTPRPSP